MKLATLMMLIICPLLLYVIFCSYLAPRLLSKAQSLQSPKMAHIAHSSEKLRAKLLFCSIKLLLFCSFFAPTLQTCKKSPHWSLKMGKNALYAEFCCAGLNRSMWSFIVLIFLNSRLAEPYDFGALLETCPKEKDSSRSTTLCYT